MRRKLRWGVIGTGEIASDFTAALAHSQECDVVNVVGSSPGKAQEFASRFELPSYSTSIDKLVAQAGVEAVYVASPNPLHEEHALKCIAAGKHVLCEKPIALDAKSAQRIISAAKEARVFLMEGYMYRCHPILPLLLERLSSGAIGAIRHVRAQFGFRCDRDAAHRLFNPALGGGAIFDVGGYPMSFARLLAGISAGKPFAEPARLVAVGERGPTGVDERAACLLQFDTGFTAELGCATTYPLGTEITILGDGGSITLENLWLSEGKRHGLTNQFVVARYGAKPEIVTATAERSIYALEAEAMLASLGQHQPRWPLMSWEDSLGNARALDAWRAELGF